MEEEREGGREGWKEGGREGGKEEDCFVIITETSSK